MMVATDLLISAIQQVLTLSTAGASAQMQRRTLINVKQLEGQHGRLLQLGMHATFVLRTCLLEMLTADCYNLAARNDPSGQKTW